MSTPLISVGGVEVDLPLYFFPLFTEIKEKRHSSFFLLFNRYYIIYGHLLISEKLSGG